MGATNALDAAKEAQLESQGVLSERHAAYRYPIWPTLSDPSATVAAVAVTAAAVAIKPMWPHGVCAWLFFQHPNQLKLLFSSFFWPPLTPHHGRPFTHPPPKHTGPSHQR